MTQAQAPAHTTPREDYLRSLAIQACIYTWPLYEMQRMRAATSARKAPGQGFAGDSLRSHFTILPDIATLDLALSSLHAAPE